jgi:small subunit ribosomal protein S15e
MEDTKKMVKRSFRRNTYRGVDLKDLLDMKNDALVKLFRSRQRRRFSHGIPSKYYRFLNKLRKMKKECPQGEKPKGVKTHLRNCIIMPEMVHSVVEIYNGKTFNSVDIKPDMIGHYLAEFSITYKPVTHGKPGQGSTHGSKFVTTK